MRKEIALQGSLASQIREIYDEVRGNIPERTNLSFEMPAGTTFEFSAATSESKSLNKGIGNITNGPSTLKQSQSVLWSTGGVFTNPVRAVTLDRILYIKTDLRSLSTTSSIFPNAALTSSIPSGTYFDNSGSVMIVGQSYNTISHLSLISRIGNSLTYDAPVELGDTSATTPYELTTLNDVTVDFGARNLKTPENVLRFTLNHSSSDRVFRVNSPDSFFCGAIPTSTTSFSDYFLQQSIPFAYFLNGTTNTAIGNPSLQNVNVDFPILLNNNANGIARYDITLVSGASSILVATNGFSVTNQGFVLSRKSFSTLTASERFDSSFSPRTVSISRGRTASITVDSTASGPFMIFLVPATETATSSVIAVARGDT